MNTIIEFLQGIVQLNEVYILLGLLAAQIFFGVFAAMLQGTFEVSRFLDFYKKIGLYFTAYLGAGIISQVLTDWGGYQAIVFGAICALIVDKILKNLSESGLPVPEGLPLVGTLMNAPRKIVGKRE